ncbi:MAG: Fic family protein [Armatimonadota bacterium]
MEFTFPSLQQVLLLHDRTIVIHGGSQGIRDIGLVESALFAAQQTFGGQDLYPTIAAKAGALWHGFVCNHGFVDGNKRIGLIVASTFLRMNGFQLGMPQAKAEEITLELASGLTSRQVLIQMIEQFVVPLVNQNRN